METQVVTRRNTARTKKAKRDEKFIQKEIQCAYCRGTGKDPFPGTWSNSLCQICRGRKRNLISFLPEEEKLKKCPFCGGRGVHPYTRMTCIPCKGKGWVVIYKGSVTCPLCKGEGRNKEKAFECTRCGGKGELILI